MSRASTATSADGADLRHRRERRPAHPRARLASGSETERRLRLPAAPRRRPTDRQPRGARSLPCGDADGCGSPSGYPMFNSPKELARAIAWTDWDACSTASNHSGRQGPIRDRDHAAGPRPGRPTHARHPAHAGRAGRSLILPVRASDRPPLLHLRDERHPLCRAWSVDLISTRRSSPTRAGPASGAPTSSSPTSTGARSTSTSRTSSSATSPATPPQTRVMDVIVGQHVQSCSRFGASPAVSWSTGRATSSAQTAACCPAESQDGLIAVIHVRAVGTKNGDRRRLRAHVR